MAGRRLGVEDTLNGKLYLELCRLIGEVRPSYFVAENVRGILSANGGAAVKLVLAAFLRLGYRTEYRLVNMAEHGVPQTRERVIFVGVRLDKWRGSFRFPEKTHRLRGDKRADGRLLPAVSLRRAISDLGDPREKVGAVSHGDAAEKRANGPGVSRYHYSQPRLAIDPSHSQVTIPNVLHVRTLGAVNAYDESAKRGRRPLQDGGGRAPTVLSNASPMLAEELVGARNNDFFNPLRSAGEPSPVIVASEPREVRSRSNHEANDARVSAPHAMSKRVAHRGRSSEPTISTPPQNAPFIDGMRRMTVRECARVQTFPDWFEFAGSQADGYRQVGNAVPPLYARLLAEAILEYDRRR